MSKAFCCFLISLIFVSFRSMADTPLSIQDTSMQDYLDCTPIVATHYKNKKIKVKFSECLVKSGGVHFVKETAPRRYFYKKKPFMGAVDRLSDGHVFYLLKDLENVKVKGVGGLPELFNCKNDDSSDLQCMVCDCFFKDREKSFDEQVMLSRVTLSQVISPSFSNSACKVIHAPEARNWTKRTSATVLKAKPNFKLQIGESSKDLNPGHKKQFRRCTRAVVKSLKFKNNFFASHYIGKKDKDPNWLKACNKDMKTGKILLREEFNLMNHHDWSNDYYKICTQKENRCLSYDTCKAPSKGAPKIKNLPSKETRDALLM